MKEKHSNIPKLLLSIIIFLVCTGVLLSRSDSGFRWGIPLQLITMISGLVALAELLHIFFHHWSPKSGKGRTAFTILSSAFRYILGLTGLLLALRIIGVDVEALLAGAGIVALIIGFGAESLIADVITGIFMLFEHQYEVGDIIVVGDFRGTVSQIGIRTTSIMDTGGNVQIINNSDIRNLINRSNDSSYAVCDIGIPYQGYLRKAEAVLEKTLPQLSQQYPELFPSVPKYMGVQQLDMANDAVILRISAEVNETDIYNGQRVLNRALLLAFEDANIPNPVAEIRLARE